MPFSCGMDLRARACHVGVIDEARSLLVQHKGRNERAGILRRLEPFNASLHIVVESTFTWYWLVDGLQEAGSDVCLAQTLGLSLITGAPGNTARRDAWAVATLLKAGMIPRASLYPHETRPLRDLLRQRSRLVALRAAAYGSLRRLRLRHGLLEHARHDSTEAPEEALQRWWAPPGGRLHGEHARPRIALYTQPLAPLASQLLATVQARPALHRLLPIPGLGQILARPIVDAIGAMARFQRARAFSSDCRLVPGGAPSGPVSRRGRHAKPGSPPLQWAFSPAALSAVRDDPKLRRDVDRHLGRHRGKGGQLIADEISAPTLAQAVDQVLRDGTVDRAARLFRG